MILLLDLPKLLKKLGVFKTVTTSNVAARYQFTEAQLQRFAEEIAKEVKETYRV